MSTEIPNHDELLDDPLYRDEEIPDEEEKADSDMEPEDWED